MSLEAREPVEAGARDKPKILVVDDDLKNLIAIEAALGDFAGHLDTVRSGTEALKRLLQHEYALILLDIQMPDLDGFETAKLIRRRTKTQHLPIIFLTAYDQSDSRVLEGYELGAVDFLFKPIAPAILRAKATVFVELTRRTEEVKLQAEQLRAHERREALALIERERQQWEQESLRREMEQQRRLAEETQARAEQLAEIAAQREAAQRELAHSNARLAEVDRRKNEFLATLAHELRNPLAPLRYAVGILRDSSAPDVRECSERMSRQLGHLTRLVDDLLDVSRVTCGKIELRRERIDLRDAVHRGIELCRDALTRYDSQLDIQLPDEPVWVDADSVRVDQIIGNLVNNAARYTQDGGQVEVEVAVDGEVARLSVRDDGPGVAESMLETIFDAFVQAESNAGGLGLGLHLAERLVKLHEGSIRVRNRARGGACFDVELPLARASEERPAPGSPVQSASTRSLQIAIIEDEDDIREMSRMLLQHWGHQTREASNGRAGIELVCEHADDIDVVLVDIGLPDTDGYEVATTLCETLAERCPPLVAVTGWGQARDSELALASGFTAHLVKPVSVDALRETLESVAEHGGRRQSAEIGDMGHGHE